ncbi:hypothetical protein Fmac_019962 [Flemingia macrophylla]|uniref:Uncharacterized protein n=1 Tax=Flemingia macrophylla TaxID=520843 RepID=A0ABD1M9A4_9FABA
MTLPPNLSTPAKNISHILGNQIRMFDALLKPKFYTKCSKSRLKLIKIRLEMIRKKRNAVQKFLKKDIAELLSHDLDYNAYGRAEGLLVEKNVSACYELIAKFASCLSGHVRDLCKQRDISDECMQAIQSLIYAASRFSDLPELRQLRTLFMEKFGKDTLEPYISIEFVEKLRQHPPSKEMKIQLLCDISQEFSIEWDSKSLEHRLNTPLQLYEEKVKLDGVEWDKNNVVAVSKIDDMFVEGKQKDRTDCNSFKGNDGDTPSQEKKDISNAYWRLQSSTDDETATDNSSLDDHKAGSTSLGSVSEDDAEIKMPFSYKLVPPPYVKENLNKGESNLKNPTESEGLLEKESNQNNEPIVLEKPIPRSVRRRPVKPPLDNNSVSDSKTGGPANVNSRGKDSDKAKQHQQTKLVNNTASRDDEEEIMDVLLLHYSKKRSPPKSRMGKTYPLQGQESENGHTKPNSCLSLVRRISLPAEDTSSMQTLQSYERAISLIPEMLKTSGHVHPSLPDYDDLSARLATLRNTSQPAA